jgi:hypothetical protein
MRKVSRDFHVGVDDLRQLELGIHDGLDLKEKAIHLRHLFSIPTARLTSQRQEAEHEQKFESLLKLILSF